ncbi:MAG: hypothetical protein QGD94_05365 [Planctomycetia bacterium]|nr:hypothetical protein [Planctomycetia bacterium]
MKLPPLDTQKRYDGLYVVDFGDQVGAGYTAEEVGYLLESEKFAAVKVYKIHRLCADGTLELKGVSAERFHLENCMVFYCSGGDAAQRDFDELAERADRNLLPCRARVLLARLPKESGPVAHVVAIFYPAEYEDEISRWLIEEDYRGGECVAGGLSMVERFHRDATVTAHKQLPCEAWRRSRSRKEVFEAVGIAIQR